MTDAHESPTRTPSGNDEVDDDERKAARDPDEQVRRFERLREALLEVEVADVKVALAGLLRPVQESVATEARVRVPALLRSPSRRMLARMRDPRLVDVVADAVSDDCLEAIRDELGDQADDPDREALSAAVDAVADRFSTAMIRLTLAVVAAGGAPASEVCDEMVDGDARFEMADEPGGAEPAAVAPATTGPPAGRREVSDDKREARRARQAAERERRRTQQEKATAAHDLTRALRKKSGGGTDDDTDVEEEMDTETPPAADAGTGTGTDVAVDADADADGDVDGGVTVVTRRPPNLTPEHAERFVVDHPSIGAVVIAEVPFDDDDATDHAAKSRPCVVVGVSSGHLLLRPGYSKGGVKARTWKSYELVDWRSANLHSPTWIEAEARPIARHMTAETVGMLSTRDWNALW